MYEFSITEIVMHWQNDNFIQSRHFLVSPLAHHAVAVGAVWWRDDACKCEFEYAINYYGANHWHFVIDWKR